MALPDIRHRTGYLFLVVAVGHIVLISAQVNSRAGVPLLEAVVFGAFSEVQRAAAGVIGSVQYVWSNYVALQHAQRDNEALRRQLVEAEVKLQELRAAADRSARLEALLGFRERSGVRTMAATVIAGSASPDVLSVTIDRGTQDGLHDDMAVLAPAGVVGRVFTSARHAASVQLLLDRNAAAGALLERSREQGVVFGTGDDVLELQYVASTADVREGDRVLSSGLDGIYPKGFVIGRVERIARAGGAYTQIVVRPAADFSALEEVLVVVDRGGTAEAGPLAKDGGPE